MKYNIFKGNKSFEISFNKIYIDFDLFTRIMIVSGDDDPTYPMIKSVYELYDFEPHWFVFMYHAFYSIESAVKMCKIMPAKEYWNEVKFRKLREKNKFSFGYERRGLRNVDNQVKHLNAVVKFLDEIDDHLIDNLTYRRGVENLPQNGGWASFKNAEIFEKALGYKQLEIPDLGIDHRDVNSDSDGPIPALRLLYGWENHYFNDIIPAWNRLGVALAEEYGVSVGKIETCLCKFIKPIKGQYFPGHDIYEFHSLKDVLGMENWETVMNDNFSERFLEPITHEQFKRNNKYYSEKGKYLNSDFASEMESVNVLEVILNID